LIKTLLKSAESLQSKRAPSNLMRYVSLPVRNTGDVIFWGLIFLLAVRIVCSLIGFDRMPLVPAEGDEAFFNDPAVTLAEGGSFTAAHFVHSALGLDRIYAPHPPLFMLLQAATIKAFGFTVASLRLGAILAGNGALLIFLLGFRRLMAAGFIDPLGMLAAVGLTLIEPGLFSIARWGRPDTVMLLFAMSALYCLVLIETSDFRRRSLYPLGGVFLGLAFATHLEAVTFAVPFGLYGLVRLRRLGILRVVAGLPLPLVLLIGICLLTWGDHWRMAIAQLRAHVAIHVATIHGPGLELGTFLDQIRQNDVPGIWAAGGFGLGLMMFAPALFLLRALLAGIWDMRLSKEEGFFGFTGCTATLLFVLYLLILPTSQARFTVAEPLACASIGASLSVMQGIWRRALMIALLGIASAQTAGLAIYATHAAANWQERSPNRFDLLLAQYPRDAIIVAAPNLWFALARRSANFAILNPYLNERKNWENDPSLLDDYAIVILEAGDKLIERVATTHPHVRTFDDGWKNFVALSH
jgi:4-amino-4-deoxy-L-arabinose transferase-like glycosyltransferase